jgi:hypothetical protein
VLTEERESRMFKRDDAAARYCCECKHGGAGAMARCLAFLDKVTREPVWCSVARIESTACGREARHFEAK